MLSFERAHVLAALALTLAAACASNQPEGSGAGAGGQGGESGGVALPPAVLGESCADGRACEGRGLSCVTGDAICSRYCAYPSDCYDGSVCEPWMFGSSICLPSCSTLASQDGFMCSDSAPCGSPEADCDRCGCAENQVCREGRCTAAAQVGEACLVDGDCATGNCSVTAGVCRVALGDFCDETNCDRCMVYGDWSSCSRSCSGFGSCGSGFECRGFEPNYYCYEPCGERTCPVACDEICQCSQCDILEAKRAAGEACESNAQCGSGTCFGAPFDSAAEGTCAEPCAADGACADGFRCFEEHCLPTCDQGSTCRVNPTTFVSVMCGDGVCDPRAANGDGCTVNQECRSGLCMEGKCRGAAASGESCAEDGDCAQGFCCSGTCRSAC